ncbi:MAG: hypothetical protein WC812_01185 [Candidatus Pacearchaeota archaeon]|jgi:hypothetical protein
MEFKEYSEKLKKSKEYKDFLVKNKGVYFFSGFFSIDHEGKELPQINFDFYVPSSSEIYSFKFGEKIEITPVDNYDKRIPEKLSLDFNFKLEDFQDLILKEMKDKEIKNNIKKFLFSYQSLEKKPYLLVTVFLSNFGLLKAHIDVKEKRFISFEKSSILDMMKILKK